jgi:hypothetical protein
MNKGLIIKTGAGYQVRSASGRNYVHYPIHPEFPVYPNLNGKQVQYEPIKYFGNEKETTVADIKIVFSNAEDAPMKELLATYKNTIEEIFKRFGLEDAYGEIDIKDEVEWVSTDESVHWIEDECEYSNDVLYDSRTDGEYTILYVDNGCGDRFYQIFKNSLYKEDLEF